MEHGAVGGSGHAEDVALPPLTQEPHPLYNPTAKSDKVPEERSFLNKKRKGDVVDMLQIPQSGKELPADTDLRRPIMDIYGKASSQTSENSAMAMSPSSPRTPASLRFQNRELALKLREA